TSFDCDWSSDVCSSDLRITSSTLFREWGLSGVAPAQERRRNTDSRISPPFLRRSHSTQTPFSEQGARRNPRDTQLPLSPGTRFQDRKSVVKGKTLDCGR